jgi:hypothetical protein
VDGVETGWTEPHGGDWVNHEDQKHHLAKVRFDYVLGAKWLLRVRLLADRTLVFRRLPGNKHRRIRVG